MHRHYAFAATSALLILAVVAPPVGPRVTLDLLGRYDSGSGDGGAGNVAYHATSKRMYSLNRVAGTVDVVDMSDPRTPARISSIEVATFGTVATSIAVSHDLVAVTVWADAALTPGRVAFYDTEVADAALTPGDVVFYDTEGGFLGRVETGFTPVMVTFTPDGEKVLVANEGRPDLDGGDPPGSVTLIDVSSGIVGATGICIGFEDFDAGGPRAGEVPAGVRIFGPDATVAQDLEPEYIAVAPDGATAYVSLQDNNALAILDIETGRVRRLVGLGFKDHSLPGNGLDASGRDSGIHIENWPIFGMYQPDGLATFSTASGTYLLSANEGDARDHAYFSEVSRFHGLDLDETAFPGAVELRRDDRLGRLEVTTALGDADGDGDFDAAYSYGARSFSIWDGSGSLVYDSGDDFEQILAKQVPRLFNADDGESFDARSEHQGPEPEGIVVGEVGDRSLAFIGLERAGGVMVYDVTDPDAPRFMLYEPSYRGDLSPEGMVFVPAASSPHGQPLLLVAHERSGTVSIYRVGSRREKTRLASTIRGWDPRSDSGAV